MTDVKDTETQASETQNEEQNTEEAETSTENNASEGVDYQKELEMARKELDKKDKRIGQAEHVIEKLKEEGTKVDAESVEAMVKRLVNEEVQTLTSQVRQDAIDGLITQYSSSKDEAELIKHHLENSIKPSGDDVTDIVNAKALANKARFTQQTSEMQRAKMQTEGDKATSAGEKQSSSQEPKLSAEELKIMRAYGLSKEDLEKGVR